MNCECRLNLRDIHSQMYIPIFYELKEKECIK